MSDRKTSLRPSVVIVPVGIFLVLFVGFMFLTDRSHPKEFGYVSECKSRLRCLSNALHSYHDTYKAFPPALVRDEKDRPYLSWRTLVLPFVEQSPMHHPHELVEPRELYRQYRLAEPWDSPHNKSLIRGHIPAFQCPANRTEVGLPTTNYVAVIGPNTAWRADGTVVSVNDFTDGISNTILLVETKAAGIHIFEPRDLLLDQMSLVINPELGQGISSDHRFKKQWLGVHVLFADGGVKRLPDNLTPDVLLALFTINGGEKVIQDDKGWRLAP